MAKITVNGSTFEVPDGASVSINNGSIVVNGGNLTSYSRNGNVQIDIQGNVGDLTTEGSVKVSGNSGAIKADGSVTVGGAVAGSVKADGSVTCKDVQGDLKAGGSVSCGNVGGSVKAGGSIVRR